MTKNSKFQTKALWFESFEISPILALFACTFVSDFDIRISNFFS